MIKSIMLRIRRARERNRKINEAINRQLTPEMRLKLLRVEDQFTHRMLWVFVSIGFACLLLLAAGLASTSAKLENFAGESAWESLEHVGEAEFAKVMPAVYVVLGVALFFAAFVVWEIWCSGKKEQKLEREILARLEREARK